MESNTEADYEKNYFGAFDTTLEIKEPITMKKVVQKLLIQLIKCLNQLDACLKNLVT